MQTGMLAIDKIRVNPDNRPDGSGDDVTGMVESMDTFGILSPLIVVPAGGGYVQLQAGHRRLQAAIKNGDKKVPVIVRDRTELPRDTESLLIMLVENYQRVGLGPVETAKAMGALVEKGLKPADIARHTGLTQPTISYHLQLLRADEATLQRLKAGQLTAASVHEAVKGLTSRDGGAARPPRRARQARRRAPAHFTATHRLAPDAHALCTRAGHPTGDRLGKVACGPCWEQAICDDYAHAGGRQLAAVGRAS